MKILQLALCLMLGLAVLVGCEDKPKQPTAPKDAPNSTDIQKGLDDAAKKAADGADKMKESADDAAKALQDAANK